MIDFHNHLLPGVDDGAADLEQTRAALALFAEQGVSTVVVTPHVRGTVTASAPQREARLAELEAAWKATRALAEAEFPAMRLERGVELMLDTPTPDLTDPRLRLAGTRFVLVEFPAMAVPPHGVNAFFEMKMQGWTPVLAHPERYEGLDAALAAAAEWCRVGALLQVNAGSFLGRYGEREKAAAWGLLRRGMISYLSSDYHARGRLAVQECRAVLAQAGGAEQARLLTEVNPERLLAGQPPLPVPPLEESRSLWSRLFGRRHR